MEDKEISVNKFERMPAEEDKYQGFDHGGEQEGRQTSMLIYPLLDQSNDQLFSRNQEITELKMNANKRLSQCPPDFDLAQKHGEASIVRPLIKTNLLNLDDKESYCE